MSEREELAYGEWKEKAANWRANSTICAWNARAAIHRQQDAEIKKDFFKLASERIENEKRQATLFAPERTKHVQTTIEIGA